MITFVGYFATWSLSKTPITLFLMLQFINSILFLIIRSVKGNANKYIALLLTLLFTFIGSSNCLSQTHEIDSLKFFVKHSGATEKANALLLLAKKYQVMNFDSVIKYANEALDYSLLIEDNNLAIKALMQLAYININIGQNSRAKQYYNCAKKECVRERNLPQLAQIYMDLGRYNIKLSNYAGVISSLDSALNIITSNNISYLEPVVYYNIGRLYYSINDLETARYYADISFNLSKNKNNAHNHINSIFLLGDIFLKQNLPDSSLICFNNALSIAKGAKNKKLIQNTYRKIANYYLKINKLEISSQYIDSSITYCKELTLINELAALITYKAHIQSLKNNYSEALLYNYKALELRETTGHSLSVASSFLNIGSNYTQLGEFENAKLNIEKGLQIAKNQKSIFYLDYGYGKLSELYRKEGKYKQALYYSDLKQFYKDSMMVNRNNEEVVFFKSQYELEKQKTISEKLKVQQKANEQILLLVTILLSVVVIILLVRFVYTKRKSTKEILKLSKVIETTSQSVIILNSDAQVDYANNGLVKLLGFSHKDDMLGKSIKEFTNDEGSKLIVKQIFPDLLKNGHWKGEIVNRKKDGELFISEVTCSVINDKYGNPENYVAILQDISERKKIEADLHLIRQNLEKTVNTQDKMFSIIAHDLTGPFNSILGLSELMAKEYDAYKRADHIKFSSLIYKSSMNTFNLLTNLLQWSRSQLGNIDLKFEKININELVSRNVELTNLALIKKDLKFNNEIGIDMVAYADYNTMGVVIRNLISNAIKFTPRGGTISASAIKENSIIRLIISDTGVGIEIEDLAALFDILSTKTQQGTEGEKGTGLGLVLCKEFTELNNGTIAVESTYGEGSKFIVTLPAHE